MTRSHTLTGIKF